MLLYHNCEHCSTIALNNKRKPPKKDYKLSGKRKPPFIRTKPLGPSGGGGGRKKKNTKKELSNKNRRFLEGLGLKVKQSVENC